MSKTKKGKSDGKKKGTKSAPAPAPGRYEPDNRSAQRRVSIADPLSQGQIIDFAKPRTTPSKSSIHSASAPPRKYQSSKKEEEAHRTYSGYVIPHRWDDGAESDRRNVNFNSPQPKTSTDFSSESPTKRPAERQPSVSSLFGRREVSKSFRGSYTHSMDQHHHRDSASSGPNRRDSATFSRAAKSHKKTTHHKHKPKKPKKPPYVEALLLAAVILGLIGVMAFSLRFL